MRKGTHHTPEARAKMGKAAREYYASETAEQRAKRIENMREHANIKNAVFRFFIRNKAVFAQVLNDSQK